MEAVSTTIEMESYLQPKPSRIAQVEPELGSESVVTAIQHQREVLLDALDKVMEKLERLEAKSWEQPPGPSVGQNGGSSRKVIMCRRCHREGFYARGYASVPLPSLSGTDQRNRGPVEPMSLLPVTHSSGLVNEIPTSFVVDTGASITVLDQNV